MEIEYAGDWWLGFDPKYHDDQIAAYCAEKRGWTQIRLTRRPHIVLVQPIRTKEKENGRSRE